MNSIQPTGRKEAIEAVAIAALITLANALVTWGVDTAKSKLAEAKKRRADMAAQEALERKAREAAEVANAAQKPPAEE